MIGKNQELPKARLADVLERNPVIKIDDNKLYVRRQNGRCKYNHSRAFGSS